MPFFAFIIKGHKPNLNYCAVVSYPFTGSDVGSNHKSMLVLTHPQGTDSLLRIKKRKGSILLPFPNNLIIQLMQYHAEEYRSESF